MPLTKVSLNQFDIQSLKGKKRYNSRFRIWISFISILVFAIIYLSVGFDASNNVFKFFAIVTIVAHLFLFISSTVDNGFSHDLKEKQKYAGILKAIKKEHWIDDENGWERFKVDFGEWKIGVKSFQKAYWEKINEGDEFYIEQAVNSGFVFKLEKDNVDFKMGLQIEIK
ncbi:hypothetical protein [Flavobacterium foetidum]|uniref:hypothetical protein n=1 Tax=Flavobacterium foetidum TaxID=2026681 RepID=UPI001074A4CA|nr:hypothetical protein [Flavobacterium foetidum]KAF2517916.1 hypothetical protein E0W73_01520 [Flavobacterium foetidum]